MIEFGARLSLKDNMYATMQKNIKQQKKFSEQVEKTRSSIGKLGKQKANPIIAVKDKASKIISNTVQGLKNIGKAVAKATITIKDKATAVLSKVGGMLKSLAKGVTIGLGVAGAGVTALVGGSLSAGASMEQNIGGVETMFGADAGAVMANANNAYKTAGLSANEYMETVTSFSASLLQSLGGDTMKASSVADMALTDMADNANKFGTDMGSIQNAYQGFAKQNYTMLDNLKLGYGGTKEEMQRLLKDAQKITGVKYDINNLSDVYGAIHAIQENMGVTGTTAKEASSTFSGSFASMKASAQNLLSGLALGGDITPQMEQLMDSASTFLFENAIPMIGRIFEGLPTAIGVAIEKGLPKIKELGGNIATALKEGLKSMLPAGMAEMVDPAFDGIRETVSTIVPVLTQIFNTVVPALQPILATLGSMFQTIFPVIMSVITAFGNIVAQVFPIISSVISIALNSVMPIIQTLSSLIQMALPIVSNIISVVAGVLQSVMPTISQIFMEVGAKVAEVINAVVVPVMNTLQGVFEKVSPFIQSAIETVVSVLSACWDVISPILDLAMVLFEALWAVLDPIITAVVDGFLWLWDVLEPVFSWLSDALSAVGDFIGSIGDWIGGFFGGGDDSSSHAYGLSRVPYDNYPANLHQGEKVLTRNQADQYDRTMSTRGVQISSIASPSNTSSASAGGANITIEKLADTVVIEKEADVDRVVEDMVKKFRKLVPNMA